MQQSLRAARYALEDYVKYHYERLDKLGYPEETVEYKMMREGVRKEKKRDVNARGVLIPVQWGASRETRQLSMNYMPSRLDHWGSETRRKTAISVHDMPRKWQRIVYAVFHPDRENDTTTLFDIAELLGYSPATLKRRIREIYHKVSRDCHFNG